MKKDIHPEYRDVIFVDDSSGEQFLIGSTIQAEETGTFDGKEYPLVHIEISSKSHPFYTGQEKVLDTAGRVEKFKARAKAASGGSKKAEKKIVKKEEKLSAEKSAQSEEKEEKKDAE